MINHFLWLNHIRCMLLTVKIKYSTVCCDHMSVCYNMCIYECVNYRNKNIMLEAECVLLRPVVAIENTFLGCTRRISICLLNKNIPEKLKNF